MCFHGDVTVSTFSFPTTILFGAGAVGRLPEELSKRGISRPLLVTDAGLARTPVFARVASLAPGAVVFSAVEPNPTERNMLDGRMCFHGGVTVSTFSFPTTILFGAGAVGSLPEELSKRGISRPLLVTDADGI